VSRKRLVEVIAMSAVTKQNLRYILDINIFLNFIINILFIDFVGNIFY